jgi:small GTP-binding protein
MMSSCSVDQSAAWEYEHLVKVLMLGDASVGKTSLVNRFCGDSFTENTVATIGIDFKWKNLEHNGAKLRMQVWDTAGQERFRTLSPQYYRAAHGVVVCFDCTERRTFENLGTWLQAISENRDGEIQVIIVANKMDLSAQRAVSTAEGEALAKKHGFAFFEVSAKSGAGVETAFLQLVDKIERDTWRPRDSHATVLGSTAQEDKKPCQC